ncbi:MAG: hypothetical protein ACPGSN_04125 [Psychrobium sp.]
MEFKAGIGCRYPLFCDIAGWLISAIVLVLVVWFIFSLIKTSQQQKSKAAGRRKLSQDVAKRRKEP